MNVLVYCWNNTNELSLIKGLKSKCYNVFTFRQNCIHMSRDFDLANNMIQFVHHNKIDCVISFDFYPIISMVCEATKIDYYSWVYDCPHPTLYSVQANHPCNHIAIFDKAMVEALNKRENFTVFHLPLAVDCDYADSIITSATTESLSQYKYDVSFVGSMYNDSQNYCTTLPICESIRLETIEIITSALFNYDNYFKPHFSNSIIDSWHEALQAANLLPDQEYIYDFNELFYSCIIQNMATSLERPLLISEICKQTNYNTALFTNSDLGSYPRLSQIYKGILDYNTELPVLFNQSKINLNITLRSIESGIPLRILDIMAAKGFVLSNYQPEIEELFDIDNEIVVFTSPEECIDKIHYYLTHEEERIEIANKGYQAVLNRFNYSHSLEMLFNHQHKWFLQ